MKVDAIRRPRRIREPAGGFSSVAVFIDAKEGPFRITAVSAAPPVLYRL